MQNEVQVHLWGLQPALENINRPIVRHQVPICARVVIAFDGDGFLDQAFRVDVPKFHQWAIKPLVPSVQAILHQQRWFHSFRIV